MRFEFATATRIIFGDGTIAELGPIAAEMGNCAFVVTAGTTEPAQAVFEQLDKQQIKHVTFDVTGEPTTTIVNTAAQQARTAGCDLVIGVGGGSAIDTGKAVAAMLTNAGELNDYLEVVGLGKPLTNPAAPNIAVPTTAGTGAEVTRNAVLGVPERAVKVSMRSPLMLPHLALVDPVLTHSMPPTVTAATGLDALTQLMEVYVSNKANPLTDGICREGLGRAARSLRKAFNNGADGNARRDMSLASLFGGLALANARLGAVHGFAGPLGGMISAPHGVICARLLPYVMETNVNALKQRSSQSEALARYDEIARILTGDTTAKAANGVAWVRQLCGQFNISPLSKVGLKAQDLPTAVAKAQKASSMKGNPITLTEDELLNILEQAC